MFKQLHHEDCSIFHFHVKEMFYLDRSSSKRQVTIKSNVILYYKVIKIKQGKDKSKCTTQNLLMLFGDTVDLSVTLEEFYDNTIKLQNQITFLLSLCIGCFITRHIRNTCLACTMKKILFTFIIKHHIKNSSLQVPYQLLKKLIASPFQYFFRF